MIFISCRFTEKVIFATNPYLLDVYRKNSACKTLLLRGFNKVDDVVNGTLQGEQSDQGLRPSSNATFVYVMKKVMQGHVM